MKKSAIIIFIKNPDLGRVKRRLANTVGDEKALEIYRQMLDHAQQITRNLSTDKFLFYDRAIDKNDSWPNDIYIKKKQTGPNLPLRITNAFAAIFKLGYENVLGVGSDCLELDERIIRLAFRQLGHFDIVLGPAKDGGFYLLGMNEMYSGIFSTKEWGTAKLSSDIIKITHHLHKSCFLLPELTGIITISDLKDNIKSLTE